MSEERSGKRMKESERRSGERFEGTTKGENIPITPQKNKETSEDANKTTTATISGTLPSFSCLFSLSVLVVYVYRFGFSFLPCLLPLPAMHVSKSASHTTPKGRSS